MPNEEILDFKQLCKMTELGAPVIYRLIYLNNFPKPSLQPSLEVGWRKDEIKEWLRHLNDYENIDYNDIFDRPSF